MLRKLVVAVLLVLIGLNSNAWAAAQKKNNNNKAQEKKDDARVQNEKEGVKDAEKRIQSDLKEIRAAELESKKSADVISTARKTMQETSQRLESWISKNLQIPEAIEAQRAAQAAYDEATKPFIAAMKTDPKFMPSIARAEKASSFLKSISSDTTIDPATRQQFQSQASKDLSDWRYTMTTHLESISELKYPREKLLAAQTKLSELRAQLKKQLELHPDLVAAEKKWNQAKNDHEKTELRVATLRRKVAADQSKLASEQSQLNKAILQDKKNDGPNKKNKPNNNKKKK